VSQNKMEIVLTRNRAYRVSRYKMG